MIDGNTIHGNDNTTKEQSVGGIGMGKVVRVRKLLEIIKAIEIHLTDTEVTEISCPVMRACRRIESEDGFE